MRVVHNHTYIVDTTKALHVWEHDGYPQYYFPASALKNCKLQDKETVSKNGKVVAAVVELTIPAGDGFAEVKCDRVIRFADSDHLGVLKGLVRLEFKAMGQSPCVLLHFPTTWVR